MLHSHHRVLEEMPVPLSYQPLFEFLPCFLAKHTPIMQRTGSTSNIPHHPTELLLYISCPCNSIECCTLITKFSRNACSPFLPTSLRIRPIFSRQTLQRTGPMVNVTVEHSSPSYIYCTRNWLTIHPNVPNPHDNYWRRFHCKSY